MMMSENKYDEIIKFVKNSRYASEATHQDVNPINEHDCAMILLEYVSKFNFMGNDFDKKMSMFTDEKGYWKERAEHAEKERNHLRMEFLLTLHMLKDQEDQDDRITELEKQVESMKCCGNCRHYQWEEVFGRAKKACNIENEQYWVECVMSGHKKHWQQKEGSDEIILSNESNTAF